MLAGYPLQGVRATLFDGSCHDVDSSEVAFVAASMALREAALNASPVLLEPVMKVEVVTPEEHYGDIIGDLNRRRVWCSEWKKFRQERRSKRRFRFQKCLVMPPICVLQHRDEPPFLEFEKYREVPDNVAEALVSKPR